MARDPLYRDERQIERMAGDPEIMRRARRLWPRLAAGLLALALISAIWLIWRFG